MTKTHAKNFIDYLVSLKDNKAAISALRKCTDQKRVFEAAKYIYPFLPDDNKKWEQECFIAVSSLFAYCPNHTDSCSFGESLFRIFGNDENKGKKVLNFLKASEESVFYQLRQLIFISNKSPINWEDLIICLCGWKSYDKWAQNKIAKDFWTHKKQEAELINE